MANKTEYSGILFLFPLIIQVFQNNIKKEFKNIKFPKDVYKSIDKGENLAELKQETLEEIQSIIEEAFNNTIESIN